MIKYNREKKTLIIPDGLSGSGEAVSDRFNEGFKAGKAYQKKADEESITPVLNVSENGSYTAEYGYKKVAVDVPDKYDEGYDNGYDNGYNAGEAEGYNDGYEKGETDGYNLGYSDGFNNGKIAQKAEDDAKITPSTTITKNGEYEADYGYKKIIVNVPKEYAEPLEFFTAYLTDAAIDFTGVRLERGYTYEWCLYTGGKFGNIVAGFGGNWFTEDVQRAGIDTDWDGGYLKRHFEYDPPTGSEIVLGAAKTIRSEVSNSKPMKMIYTISIPETGSTLITNMLNVFDVTYGGSGEAAFTDDMLENCSNFFIRTDIGFTTQHSGTFKYLKVYRNSDMAMVKCFTLATTCDKVSDMLSDEAYYPQRINEREAKIDTISIF